eukprot:2566937-Pleurochrysis_carterae.AAC.1
MAPVKKGGQWFVDIGVVGARLAATALEPQAGNWEVLKLEAGDGDSVRARARERAKQGLYTEVRDIEKRCLGAHPWGMPEKHAAGVQGVGKSVG